MRKTTFAIIVLILMWGFSWPVYKIGLEYTPPILFAGLRTILGGIILGVIALPKYKQLQFKKNWPIYIVSSIFNVILFFGLQTVGLSYLPSGLFSVIVYLEPVLVGFLAWLWLKEPLTPTKIIGLILGFLGVAAVSEAGFSAPNSFLGILLGIITAIAWTIGTIYLKKVQNQVHLLWLVSMHCMIGGSFLIIAGTTFEKWSAIHWTLPYIGTLLYGMFIGTSFSWVIWSWLVQHGEVSRVSAYTFFVPMVSVVVGTLVLHEPVSNFLLIGLILTIISIYLVNRPVKQAPQLVKNTAE
ncbi:DMT family transporter [Fodinisporobacter ferrooxydans]|uniref:DMT family transporter n=1 Tax=Fodinisporobacter ferrooxydans TaxID=2901836 RepID=A0ABY4CLA3_9BACL|nr:DMT family transporter [Alicyclobacillaceae bacterium MYW30-H2]